MLCLLAGACGTQQTIQSKPADAPPTSSSDGSGQDPSESAVVDTTTTTVEEATTESVPETEDGGIIDDVATGVVGRDSVDSFEAGLQFWSSAVDVVLDEQATLPDRRSDTFDDQFVTFYNVNPSLFVAATTDDDGVITGHAFSFDPAAPSYLGFGSAYNLTIFPTELLLGPEIEQFIGDPDQTEFEKTLDDGDLLITRGGIDPVDSPIFTMTVIPSSNPSISHDDLVAAKQSAGIRAGSDVTGGELAGARARDVDETACELVDGNAQFSAKVTNYGDFALDYFLRVEVFDTNGEQENPFGFGQPLQPGESFDFDDTVDLGGGNWERCQVVLLTPDIPKDD